MIHQNLQLASALDVSGVAEVTKALGAIAGVSQVGANDGANRVAIAFDDNVTSAQEIAAVLARAGYPLREEPKTGGCCGGCGGSGH